MPATPSIVHLIRHGEVHNPRQILYGRLPYFRLTDRGRRQARATGTRLRASGIDAVFSSPMLRARQTAAEIIRQCGPLELHISSLLNEVYTAYEGCPGQEVDDRNGDIYTDAAPCFEQPEAVVERTLKFIRRELGNRPGRRIAAVTHGDIVTFMVLWAKGLALTPTNKTRLRQAGYPDAYPAHASVTTLVFQTASLAQKPEIKYFKP